MRIPKVRLQRLRNEEFFQFFTEFKELVETSGIETGILGEYPKFVSLYHDLDVVLELIRKSSYTAELAKFDSLRDMTFGGFRDTVKAFLSHFEEEKQRAAAKLMLVFNQYGNLSMKGYAEETASIYNLLQEICEKFGNELATLSLQAWVDKLNEYNNHFSTLMNARDREKSLKPPMRIVDVRRDMESCYANMVRCLEVATILNSGHTLTPFINELNSKIERYKNVLAIRGGRAKKK